LTLLSVPDTYILYAVAAPDLVGSLDGVLVLVAEDWETSIASRTNGEGRCGCWTSHAVET
jgi:hypothetical protein